MACVPRFSLTTYRQISHESEGSGVCFGWANNGPKEMKPSSGFSRIDVAGGKGYDCGAAGAFHQDSRLTSCSWSFVLEKCLG